MKFFQGLVFTVLLFCGGCTVPTQEPVVVVQCPEEGEAEVIPHPECPEAEVIPQHPPECPAVAEQPTDMADVQIQVWELHQIALAGEEVSVPFLIKNQGQNSVVVRSLDLEIDDTLVEQFFFSSPDMNQRVAIEPTYAETRIDGLDLQLGPHSETTVLVALQMSGEFAPHELGKMSVALSLHSRSLVSPEGDTLRPRDLETTRAVTRRLSCHNRAPILSSVESRNSNDTGRTAGEETVAAISVSMGTRDGRDLTIMGVSANFGSDHALDEWITDYGTHPFFVYETGDGLAPLPCQQFQVRLAPGQPYEAQQVASVMRLSCEIREGDLLLNDRRQAVTIHVMVPPSRHLVPGETLYAKLDRVWWVDGAEKWSHFAEVLGTSSEGQFAISGN